jgi:plasmid stabilization system protein ParE
MIWEVVRSTAADRDYLRIVEWLKDYDPVVARRFQIGFRETCVVLSQLSELGSPYLLTTGESARKLRIRMFKKYWMIYLIEERTIRILRVFHVSQNISVEDDS